jgi:hypothetical protein
LDDGFDSHPKLLELSEVERWRWTRVLLHCARHRTEGVVSASVLRELGLGRAVRRLVDLRLLLEKDGVLWVNDWDQFNPARRDDDELERAVWAAMVDMPDASANEIAREVGGNRKHVLTLVRRFRNGSGPGSGTSAGTGSQVVPAPVTRAGARARSRPVPRTTSETRRALQDAAHRTAPDLNILKDIP